MSSVTKDEVKALFHLVRWAAASKRFDMNGTVPASAPLPLLGGLLQLIRISAGARAPAIQCHEGPVGHAPSSVGRGP